LGRKDANSTDEDHSGRDRMGEVRPRLPERFEVALLEDLEDSGSLKNTGLGRRFEKGEIVREEEVGAKAARKESSHLGSCCTSDR